jgi:hypothetical protein
MTTDYFKKERDILTEVLEHLGDPVTVTLHELVADNYFGDPGLREAMSYAQLAGDSANVAAHLVRLALDALPAPKEEVKT